MSDFLLFSVFFFFFFFLVFFFFFSFFPFFFSSFLFFSVFLCFPFRPFFSFLCFHSVPIPFSLAARLEQDRQARRPQAGAGWLRRDHGTQETAHGHER